jgi:two-component system chemotaxis sensor kinase CheA
MLQARYTDDGLIHELGETSDHIIQVINQLQENIMKVRMVPIGIVFSRFPRLVRDLAQAQKKKLDFIIEGEETELDRSIIEQIRDPLIHLLRNAVDHGIESPEKRKDASKPETALIRLAAYHEQSHIVISVEDDGKGIDVNRIKDSALGKGLISAEEAESLSVTEVINLIFMAGMSTAEKATEVSGRGVGLDIVRTNVENLNGSISLDSKIGRGSKFTIRLPLTVAIIQGLLISSADVLYVMPLVSLVETLMVEPWEVQTIRGKEIIRLRDEILPVLRLNVVLGGEVRSTENKAKDLVVVVRASDKLVGIVVDALMERQEVVVKSLGEYLGDIEGIAGATILGDGKVALILDVASLAKMTIQGSADNKKREMRAVDTLHLTAA